MTPGRASSTPEDYILTAAGGLPGELNINWMSTGIATFDCDYGFSCMGYEISGAWGAAFARPVHGRSLVPLLAGETPADWREEAYYHYYESKATHRVPAHFGVRTTRHKLIRYYEPDENARLDVIAARTGRTMEFMPANWSRRWSW